VPVTPELAPGGATASRPWIARVVEHRTFPIAALAAIYVLSVVVYAVIAEQHRFPNLFPDEMFYGKLSQSFANGEGLEWRGSSWGLPPLWPVLLSIAWHFGSIPDGYDVARVLTAVVASTVVVPVWLLARVFLGPRLALIPTLLSVTGAWMIVTSYLVSENLAYPLAVASLACTVMAVHDTRTRWLVASFGLGVLAALTRTQMLALPVILLVALFIDIARQPRSQRRARFDARPRALWIGLAVVVAGGLLAFIVNPNLTNYDVLGHHASIGDVAATAGKHGASSIVMFAFIPVAAVVALMARGSNWRDDRVGPLLVTIAAGVIVLYPLLGRFEAWATHGNPVDRYAMYLAPLFLIGMVLAPGRIDRRAAVLSAVAVAIALFAAPITNNYIEQPALYGMQKRLFEAGFFDHHLRLAVVLFTLPILLAGAILLTTTKRVAAGLAAAVAVTGAVMVMQAWTSNYAEIHLEKAAAPLFLAKPLDWVDHYANGPVAMLAIGKGEPLRGNADLYTDFFNRKVKYLFSTEPVGTRECKLDFEARGFLKGTGVCPRTWPREYVLLERSVRLSFNGQEELRRTSRNGTLVQLPSASPRVFSLVKPPCTDDGCSERLQLGLYLDQPARVAVRFSSTPTRHRIQVGNQIRTLPAGKPTTITLSLPKGDQGVNIPVDWNSPDGPDLESVYVTSAGERTRIF
jgi:Dolichyl-phosphate-mannose-protein mannosyltransferase